MFPKGLNLATIHGVRSRGRSVIRGGRPNQSIAIGFDLIVAIHGHLRHSGEDSDLESPNMRLLSFGLLLGGLVASSYAAGFADLASQLPPCGVRHSI